MPAAGPVVAFLTEHGATRAGGEWLLPCPLFDEFHPAGSTNRYKVVCSPGAVRVAVFHCRVCPPTAAGRVLAGLGIPDAIRRRATPAEIAAAWAGSGVVPAGRPPVGPDADLDAAYAAVLGRLDLTAAHAAWLGRRGLDPAAAVRLGYRSGPSPEVAAAIAADLWAAWGDRLAGVPGFAPGPPPVLHTRPAAILTPCRTAAGLVVAVKMRLVDGRGARVRQVGSADGPRGVARCHFPVGVAAAVAAARGLGGGGGSGGSPALWVTEGERKADVHWLRTGRPTIGVPGTSTASRAVTAARTVLPPGGAVVVAMDMDAAGRAATPGLAADLAAAGYTVSVATWDGPKGIDDAVLAGVPVRVTPQAPAPTRTSPPRPSRVSLYGDDVVDFLRREGPRLRGELRCNEASLSQAIRDGRVRMAKTPRGQVVAAEPVDPVAWETALTAAGRGR